MLTCDFCCSNKDMPQWNYSARTFVVVHETPAVNYTSYGNWAACEKCHQLIQEDLRGSLAQRSLEVFFSNIDMNVHEIPENILTVIRQSIKELHDGFFKNRLGGCSQIF